MFRRTAKAFTRHVADEVKRRKAETRVGPCQTPGCKRPTMLVFKRPVLVMRDGEWVRVCERCFEAEGKK